MGYRSNDRLLQYLMDTSSPTYTQSRCDPTLTSTFSPMYLHSESRFTQPSHGRCSLHRVRLKRQASHATLLFFLLRCDSGSDVRVCRRTAGKIVRKE